MTTSTPDNELDRILDDFSSDEAVLNSTGRDYSMAKWKREWEAIRNKTKLAIREREAKLVEELSLENTLLNEQWANLMTWFIHHPNDSLDNFMRSHVSSFVYAARINELSQESNPTSEES